MSVLDRLPLTPVLSTGVFHLLLLPLTRTIDENLLNLFSLSRACSLFSLRRVIFQPLSTWIDSKTMTKMTISLEATLSEPPRPVHFHFPNLFLLSHPPLLREILSPLMPTILKMILRRIWSSHQM